ncbi:hypothetical protein [Arthrobacter sp.]|uniref:hypothetical protein n=1 Tax=Arthrobacter sp. TaxID=1667 RepID=UPI00258823FA|nr:hypothetical protein [Arthrobacter sp.]
MVTSPLPCSPTVRRRLLPSLVRLIPRRRVRQPLSPCEQDLLRDRLELDYRTRREADLVRREVELARAQAHGIIH